MSKEISPRSLIGTRCPQCTNLIDSYPSLSRRDNETYICNDCGTQEAMEDYLSSTAPEPLDDVEHTYKLQPSPHEPGMAAACTCGWVAERSGRGTLRDGEKYDLWTNHFLEVMA